MSTGGSSKRPPPGSASSPASSKRKTTNSPNLHITLIMVGNNYHSPPFFSPLKESVSTQQNKHGVATNIVDRACASIFTLSKYIFCNVPK